MARKRFCPMALKTWLAYNKWKKAGKPIPTPATEVCNDEYEDLPF